MTSARAVVAIGPLGVGDRTRWELLARGYKAFYETELADAEYERAWQRLVAGDAMHALGARVDGTLVGIAHFFFHPTVWLADACHLPGAPGVEQVRNTIGICYTLLGQDRFGGVDWR